MTSVKKVSCYSPHLDVDFKITLKDIILCVEFESHLLNALVGVDCLADICGSTKLLGSEGKPSATVKRDKPGSPPSSITIGNCIAICVFTIKYIYSTM